MLPPEVTLTVSVAPAVSTIALVPVLLLLTVWVIAKLPIWVPMATAPVAVMPSTPPALPRVSVPLLM